MSAHPFGSHRWLNHVFDTPPVRGVYGRSRPTQRHGPTINGIQLWAEGGYELVMAYILEYFQRIGVLRRFKLQPFQWPSEDDQSAAARRGPLPVPDALGQFADDGSGLVLQVKAHRYLTPDVQATFDRQRDQAIAAGLRFALWTNKRPLSSQMMQLFYQIRRGKNCVHIEDERRRMVEFIRTRRESTCAAIVRQGFDPALIPAAVYRGEVFVPLKEKLNASTIVSPSPVVNGREFLLGAGFDSKSWWNGLPRR